jgi:hypothetical protein
MVFNIVFVFTQPPALYLNCHRLKIVSCFRRLEIVSCFCRLEEIVSCFHSLEDSFIVDVG